MTHDQTDDQNTTRLPLIGVLKHASGGPALPDPDTLDAADAEAYAQLKARRAERRRKKLIRRGIALGVVAAIVVAVAVGVNVMTQTPEQTMEPITDMAMSGSYVDAVDARGSLEPLSSTVVSPTVDGTISEVRVAAGQQVNAGDVLMVIDNPDLDLAVNDAKRSLDAAKADLAGAKRTLASAGTTQATSADGGTESAVDAQAAKDAVATAQRAVEGAQATYDQAVAKAAERTVTAPTSGSIVAMNAQVGANPADTSSASGPLMQIADLSQMKVTIQVSEEDIARIAVGQSANVTFPAFDGLTLEGTVQNIASIASSSSDMMYMDAGSSVTFAVDVLISAPDPRLKPGMTAQVQIVTEQLDNVVMVSPMSLMTDDGTNYYVMVETDPETHAAERRDVEVVAQNADFAVIGRVEGSEPATTPDGTEIPLSPLSDGDTIVISGGMDMGTDGMDAL
ncbi:efflux RND transporter periplasmic adaptor subunit [Collinsella sp. An2]|uniref:efflux RND transporter periplasmic adaptor subunit n=1 Tax=Collinsella sp. An2 TaxID=1965585 RepID=UPI000B3AAFEC|nr:efflux RND transporter periplasmic adaptor subunit [Collinsella sp. An2]OUP10088.1 hypothetical protein B5F33_03280 [Collinsella sp. An2]